MKTLPGLGVSGLVFGSALGDHWLAMAVLLSQRRISGKIDLTASEPTVVLSGRRKSGAGGTRLPTLAWVGLAAGAGLVSALSSWVLTVGLTLIAWLAADSGSFGSAASVGTQLWLLANGAGATIGSVTITVIPWGCTLLIAWLVSRTAGYAARYGDAESPTTTAVVCLVATLGYLVPLSAVALVVGGPWPALRSGIVMLFVVSIATAYGAARARGEIALPNWPAWLLPVPKAVGVAVAILAIGGTGLLLVSLLMHSAVLIAMLTALDAGMVGNGMLFLAQLAYLPNAIVWAGCYALGPGFSLGGATLISPAAVSVSALPSIPILAAVPGAAASYHWLFLSLGVLAGAGAAAVVATALPADRLAQSTLVSGLAGVVAATVWSLLSWVSSGDLGIDLLAGAGPQPLLVLAFGAGAIGLSAAGCGLLIAVVRRRRQSAGPRAAAAESGSSAAAGEDEPTVGLPRLAGDAMADSAGSEAVAASENAAPVGESASAEATADPTPGDDITPSADPDPTEDSDPNEDTTVLHRSVDDNSE